MSNLIRAASVWVAEWIGLKKVEHSKKPELRWKRGIEGYIKRLRQEVNLLEKESKGELGLKKKRKLSELKETYRVKIKVLKTVIEEVKEKCLQKSAKLKKELNNLDKIESFILIRKRCMWKSMEMA